MNATILNFQLRSLRLVAATAVVILLVGPSNVLAGPLIGVGQNPAPPAGPFLGNDSQNDTITVGNSTSGRISIVPDSNGPAWVKEFVNRDGQGWSTTGPQSMVTVDEFILFSASNILNPFGDPRIYDWHEVIDPTFEDGANFKWAGGTFEFQGPSAPSFPGTVSLDGKSIWFDFPAGAALFAPIRITKQLMWTGPAVTPGANGTNEYRIRIVEQPSVPEPTSLMIACLAIVGTIGYARRRATT
ncbi:MAG TPA: PEP-CTERM sorting domain-containing protein [Candidatus Limnocylindria bacterium]|nr:PEP-CTERM sorting domain-containing protein [Candidatus Limnocylindria bacterium]